MSFGFSVLDIASAVNLGWKVCRGWQRAGGEYADITVLLDTLLVSLERIEQEAKRSNAVLVRSKHDRKELETLLAGCEPTIHELDRTLLNYKSLGRSRARNWDRLRLGVKNLGEVRTKLTSHVTAISLYLNTAGISSSTRIERTLQEIPQQIQTSIETLAEDIRSGRREASILTSYGSDEKEVWKQLRRELIAEGMTSDFIHQYKPRIKIYLRELATRGELQERSLEQNSKIAKGDDQHPYESAESPDDVEARERPIEKAPNEPPATDVDPTKDFEALYVSPVLGSDQCKRSHLGEDERVTKVEEIAVTSVLEVEKVGNIVQTERGSLSIVKVDSGTEKPRDPDRQREAEAVQDEFQVLPPIESYMVSEFMPREKDAACVTRDDLHLILEATAQGGEHVAHPTAKLHFNDCVGRKFEFPFESCRTWEGMELLINQAFVTTDFLSDQVRKGEYDLTDSEGAIILKTIWEHVRPDMHISMHMRPATERSAATSTLADPFAHSPGLLDPFDGLTWADIPGPSVMPKKKGGRRYKGSWRRERS